MAVDAGTIYSEIRIALDKLKGDVKQVDAAFDKIGQSSKAGSEKVKKNWKDSFGKVSAGAIAMSLAIAAALKATVSTFAEFEQAIANVGSVAGATADEFAKIEEAAISAGETTRFTATESANALYYLASAGFTATDSIAALDGVLQLAGATGSDLASTSASVAASISQFGLDASDATDVANIFTAAITNSQATMEKLSTALSYVGPVASTMNRSLEETAGVLQILFNNGFAASQAGTALRSALADLGDESSPVVAKLKSLGITYDEINPATNNLADVFGVLSEKIEDGGDIMSIFGKRAGSQMATLIKAGKDEIIKYTEAVTGTNAAAEAYAIQNDTLAGSFDLLNSAVQSAQIKFGKEFEPVIRDVVDGLTELVKWIADIPGPIKAAIGVAGGLTVAILAVTQAIALMSGAFAVFSGPVGIILAALTATAAAAAFLGDSLEKARTAQGELAKNAIENKDATNELAKEYDELSKKSELTSDEAERLIELEYALKGAMGEAAFSIDENTGALKLNQETLQAYNLTKVEEALIGLSKQAKANRVQIDKWYETLVLIEKNGPNSFISQAEAMKRLNALLQENREIELQLTQLVNERADLLDPAAAAERKAEKERLAALEAERLAQEEINNLYPNLIRNIKNLNAAQKAGAITELDAAEKQIKFRQEYLDFLQSEALERGDLSAENVASIQAEQAQIELLQEKVKKLKDAKKEESEAAKKSAEDLAGLLADYQLKLDELTAAEDERIELQKEAALASLKASAEGVEGYDALIAKVEEYYDALKDTKANEEFLANINSIVETSAGFFNSLLGAIGQLYAASTEKRLEQLDEQLAAELEAAGLAEETKIESLESELEAAQAIGDEETAAKLENEIQKEQITKEFEKKKAEIQYKAALSQWRLNYVTSIAQGAMAILAGFSSTPFIPVGLIAGVLATALSAVQVAAVYKAKPKPPSFATGGIVLPKGIGGSQGSQIEVAENGYPEMMQNLGPSGRPYMNEFADAIAERIAGGGGAGGSQAFIFEMNGRVFAEVAANYYNNGEVRLKL